MDIREADGRINGLALTEYLGVSVPEIAQALEITPQGLRKNPTSDKIQETANQIEQLVKRITGMVGKHEDALAYQRGIYPRWVSPP